MRRHNVTLPDRLSDRITALVKKGRFKDFSAALQEAAWKYFGEDIFDEYGVSPQEVGAAYRGALTDIKTARKMGRLKPWKA
jgi:hypothetical protein